MFSVTFTLVSFPPLLSLSLGTIMFSGRTCSRYTAGTQHRIQTDIKSSGGECRAAFLYPLTPPLLRHLSFFSFSHPSISLFFHSLTLCHYSFSVIIFCLLTLKKLINKKKELYLFIFAFDETFNFQPCPLLQLMNALKTVAFLEVNLVDYKYM